MAVAVVPNSCTTQVTASSACLCCCSHCSISTYRCWVVDNVDAVAPTRDSTCCTRASEVLARLPTWATLSNASLAQLCTSDNQSLVCCSSAAVVRCNCDCSAMNSRWGTGVLLGVGNLGCNVDLFATPDGVFAWARGALDPVRSRTCTVAIDSAMQSSPQSDIFPGRTHCTPLGSNGSRPFSRKNHWSVGTIPQQNVHNSSLPHGQHTHTAVQLHFTMNPHTNR